MGHRRGFSGNWNSVESKFRPKTILFINFFFIPLLSVTPAIISRDKKLFFLFFFFICLFTIFFFFFTPRVTKTGSFGNNVRRCPARRSTGLYHRYHGIRLCVFTSRFTVIFFKERKNQKIWIVRITLNYKLHSNRNSWFQIELAWDPLAEPRAGWRAPRVPNHPLDPALYVCTYLCTYWLSTMRK